MKRAPLSVILITRELVVRVDFDPAGGPAAVLERPRGREQTAASAVAAMRSKVQGPVLILDEGVWSETIQLPAAALAGLSDEEIATAVAFELEPTSGIPAADASVGVKRIGEEDGEVTLWVTQCRAEDRDAMAAALAEQGSTLAGIAHPAGLSAPVEGATIEVWGLTTLCRQRGALRVLGARPRQRSWQVGVDGFLRDVGEESLQWAGCERPSVLEGGTNGARVLDCGTLPPVDLGGFAQTAAEGLAVNPPCAPLIPPKAAPRWRPPALTTSLALALLVAVAMIVDHRALVGRAEVLENTANASAADASTRQAMQRQLSEQRARLTEENERVTAMRENLTAIDAIWGVQRDCLKDLLDAAASRRPAGLLLRSIQPDGDARLRFEGISGTSEAVDRYADDLGGALRAEGFDVRPAETRIHTTRQGARYFEYVIPVAPRSGP